MTKLTYLDLTGNWFTGWHLSLRALAVKCLLANQRLILPVMCACSASTCIARQRRGLPNMRSSGQRTDGCPSAPGGVPASWAYMGVLDSSSRARLLSKTISSWPSFHKVLAAVCMAVGTPCWCR
jgi:hypothetical protein